MEIGGGDNSIELRAELERRATSLIGDGVERVRYFEIGDGSGRPLWNEHPDLDSLDFGLEFDLTSGRTVGIIWDWQFDDYDLNLVDGNLQPSQISEEAEIVVSDVGEASRWLQLLRSPITGATFRWESASDDGSESPQDLILDFGGGHRVWVMAAEIRDGDWLGGSMDHVSVVFDAAVAARLGRGLP